MTSRPFSSEKEATLEKFARGAKLDKERGKMIHDLSEEALAEWERLKAKEEAMEPFLDD